MHFKDLRFTKIYAIAYEIYGLLRAPRSDPSLVTYIYVTGPEKTGLIYAKYTCSHFGAYFFFCVCYSISVSCNKFIRISCIYDEICVEMLCC